MPIDEHGMNLDYVRYFSLEEYISRIKLSDNLLYHLEDTLESFEEYLSLLSRYENKEIISYWIMLAHSELRASQEIEREKFNESIIADRGILFDSLNINHKRIHELHNFVLESSGELPDLSFKYRTTPVQVSRYNSDGSEDIFWRGANPEDVCKFMSDYIKIYKQSDIPNLNNNPFLVAALMSLLFNRIHPYTDGNGRTSRIIYNLKFTEQINKQYQTKLMISPLNISDRILTNKITYANRINQIPFDLTSDAHDAINKWFNFILTMVDEQLTYSKPRLESTINELNRVVPKDPKMLKKSKSYAS